MGSNDRQRWARVPLGHAGKYPGLPEHWCRVYDAHPDPSIDTLAGHVWIDAPGKLLHVRADWLEFKHEPPA
jgi:hypothetical protein